jgi:hypothetical protein
LSHPPLFFSPPIFSSPWSHLKPKDAVEKVRQPRTSGSSLVKRISYFVKNSEEFSFFSSNEQRATSDQFHVFSVRVGWIL